MKHAYDSQVTCRCKGSRDTATLRSRRSPLRARPRGRHGPRASTRCAGASSRTPRAREPPRATYVRTSVHYAPTLQGEKNEHPIYQRKRTDRVSGRRTVYRSSRAARGRSGSRRQRRGRRQNNTHSLTLSQKTTGDISNESKLCVLLQARRPALGRGRPWGARRMRASGEGDPMPAPRAVASLPA